MNKIPSTRLIHAYFGAEAEPFTYLDIGAREDIQYPWSAFPEEKLHVLGFEIDQEEAARLIEKFPNRTYLPHGLWSENGAVNYHLNQNRPTSSVYAPNAEFNKAFEDRHHESRVVDKILTLPVRRLDDVLLAGSWCPDFVKIDTQGGELEILKGGELFFSSNAPLVTAETWCQEVYEGAPLSHEVMAFMYQAGYRVFDMNVAASWRHRNLHGVEIRSKKKTIGFDLLFVKEETQIGLLADLPAKRLICLLEVYGFRDYCIYLLEQGALSDRSFRSGYLDILYANNIPSGRVLKPGKWRRRVEKWLVRWLKSDQLPDEDQVYPSIH